MAILYCLVEYQPVRFNEMCRYLGGIANKTLSANLKELERDGLVARREYPQIPSRLFRGHNPSPAPSGRRRAAQ